MENRVNDDDKSCVGQESSQLTIVPEDIRADLEWLAKQMSIIGANRQDYLSSQWTPWWNVFAGNILALGSLLSVTLHLRNFKWRYNR